MSIVNVSVELELNKLQDEFVDSWIAGNYILFPLFVDMVNQDVMQRRAITFSVIAE